jgi:hypothetical protein
MGRQRGPNAAYELGANATKHVYFGSGMSKTAERRERGTLNRLLKGLGIPRLTDEEYRPNQM